MDQNNRSALQEFLTPEAMLTPGVAGSVTMMITNALALNFGAPRASTGLVLSFVCGLLVLTTAKEMLIKAVLYVLNSLVIFCVAVGANGIGTARADGARFSIVGPAYAQTEVKAPQVKAAEQCSDIAKSIQDAQKKGASNEDIVRLVQPCQTLSNNILSKEIRTEKRFFAPWKF